MARSFSYYASHIPGSGLVTALVLLGLLMSIIVRFSGLLSSLVI